MSERFSDEVLREAQKAADRVWLNSSEHEDVVWPRALAAMRAVLEGHEKSQLQAVWTDIQRRWQPMITPALNRPDLNDVLNVMGHVNEAFKAAGAASDGSPR